MNKTEKLECSWHNERECNNTLCNLNVTDEDIKAIIENPYAYE